jgi:hypothetical protein
MPGQQNTTTSGTPGGQPPTSTSVLDGKTKVEALPNGEFLVTLPDGRIIRGTSVSKDARIIRGTS